MRTLTIIKFSLLFVLFSAFTLKSCKQVDGPKRSVFLWKTNEGLKESDQKTLESLEITHTYIRFGDIEWNPVFQRSEPIEGADSWDFDAMSYYSTAVIFITNEVLQNLEFPEVKDLAIKVAAFYNEKQDDFSSRYGRIYAYENIEYENYSDVNWDAVKIKSDSLKDDWNLRNNQLLIDCDWSVSTKDKYFSLLKELKIILQKTEIQSTIRLWQYRDYKLAGIPPVKRGLLMCYSTGDPKDINTENAIVDYASIQEYITHSRYPMKLDIALPVYSWGTLFRNSEFAGIISPLSINYLEENPALFEKKDSVNFIIQTDTVLGNTYYRFGDELHYQGVNAEELINIAKWVKKMVKPDKAAIISFFSYDPLYFNQIGHENIRKVFHIFN